MVPGSWSPSVCPSSLLVSTASDGSDSSLSFSSGAVPLPGKQHIEFNQYLGEVNFNYALCVVCRYTVCGQKVNCGWSACVLCLFCECTVVGMCLCCDWSMCNVCLHSVCGLHGERFVRALFMV